TTGGAPDNYSRAAGVDANFRFAHLQINGYGAVTDDPLSDGDPSTAAVQFGWRDPVLDFSVLGKHVGEAFSPEAGFVSRTGVNQWFASGGVHVQRPVPWLTELNPYVDVGEFYTPGGDLVSRAVTPGLVLIGSDGGRFSAEYSQRTEHLAAANSILGVELPAGQYDFGAATFGYTANGGRKVSGSVSVSAGDFFDGDRKSVSGTLSLRPNEHWHVEGTFQRNRLTLAGQPLDADLIRGR
ncbi:MAG: hypothetical protein GY953_36825, partial [bacterium]|nr:hypothetical protein [bacterium]